MAEFHCLRFHSDGGLTRSLRIWIDDKELVGVTRFELVADHTDAIRAHIELIVDVGGETALPLEIRTKEKP